MNKNKKFVEVKKLLNVKLIKQPQIDGEGVLKSRLFVEMSRLLLKRH